MLLYTVLNGTEKAAMLANPSLTNTHLIQHCFKGEGDIHRLAWIGKSFLLDIMHLVIGVPRTFGRD